jgi:hypothetical protein
MGKKYALMTGLNYSPLGKSWELYGCINDVNMTKNMLIDAYGYSEKNMFIFRDDINESSTFPTYNNIVGKLRELCSTLSEDDELYYHHSGHGSYFDDYGVNESDNQDEIIVVYDENRRATALLDDTFHNILKTAKCKIIMVFDSCNSGTMGDLMWNFKFDASVRNNSTIKRSQENNNVLSNQNIYIFSSARDNELAADAYNSVMQLPMGALSMAIIQCLRKNNHSVSCLKLYIDVCRFMIDNGYEQRPQFTCSAKVPRGFFSRKDDFEIVDNNIVLNENVNANIQEKISVIDKKVVKKKKIDAKHRKRSKTMRMYFT